MAKKAPTAKQLAARKAASERMKAFHAGKSQNQNPQTQSIPAASPEPQNTPIAAPQLFTFTQEQLQELVTRLSGGQTTDKAQAPAFQGQGGLQTNSRGQIVGHEVKYNIDPNYYPNPIEQLLDEFDQDVRMRRHNIRENYYISWDIDSKPYDTKYGISVQEPFFHSTLYMNMFDEQGDDTGNFIVVQTLHFNEDDGIAFEFAAEQGWEVNEDTMKQIMDATRYERMKQWLTGIFYPPRNFQPTNDASEQAIGGQVVKVVTKSNVKGFGNKAPKIEDEELQ